KAMFIKPALGSYGGKNVCKFSMVNGLVSPGDITLEQFLATYGGNFIVQKGVIQHEAMQALNPTSINTFRSHSYLHDTEATVLDVSVRMGRKGAHVDNASLGGLVCGVQKNGQMNKEGYMANGEKCFATDSGQLFSTIKLPHLDKIHAMSQTLHKETPHFRFISWDFCLDNDGDVVLIEYNIEGQEIVGGQLNNGSVLAPLLDILKT
ncbi:MAG: sugar-transfer associated ATP-grasp domain-containing protein, partial [Maribacter sp.]